MADSGRGRETGVVNLFAILGQVAAVQRESCSGEFGVLFESEIELLRPLVGDAGVAKDFMGAFHELRSASEDERRGMFIMSVTRTLQRIGRSGGRVRARGLC